MRMRSEPECTSDNGDRSRSGALNPWHADSCSFNRYRDPADRAKTLRLRARQIRARTWRAHARRTSQLSLRWKVCPCDLHFCDFRKECAAVRAQFDRHLPTRPAKSAPRPAASTVKQASLRKVGAALDPIAGWFTRILVRGLLVPARAATQVANAAVQASAALCTSRATVHHRATAVGRRTEPSDPRRGRSRHRCWRGLRRIAWIVGR